MNETQQDPQNRKDHLHTLNEWLGQEHKIGFDAGYIQGRKEGIDEMRDVAKQYSDYDAVQAQLNIEAEQLKKQGND